MEENRRAAIYLSVALLFGISVIIVTQAMVGNIVYTFYWGIPIGLLFGLAMCIYLNYAWDPYYLEPKNPGTAKASWRLWWVVPLGIISARLLSTWLGEELLYLVVGSITSLIYVTFGYVVVQAWRHRPK